MQLSNWLTLGQKKILFWEPFSESALLFIKLLAYATPSVQASQNIVLRRLGFRSSRRWPKRHAFKET